MHRWRYGAVLVAALVCGCGDSESAPDPAAPTCLPPSRLVDGLCLEPAVADDGCPAGTAGQSDGSCHAAGMGPEDCAEGFVHDGDVSCEPVLPPEPCPLGMMAVPGETACHAVLDCGSSKWGRIAVDATTQYVDQTFVGVSDGSASAPWISISDAIAAVRDGGLIAVAAGSYLEDVLIAGKAVRLHGACPASVEIVGTGAELAAVRIFQGGHGSELRGLTVRGGGLGVLLSGAVEVLFDALWVHDNAGRGIDVEDPLGETSCTVRGSLIERNFGAGLILLGAEATVEASIVRDTAPDAAWGDGRGLHVQIDQDTGNPGRATVHRVLVERNHQVGVFVSDAEAGIDATVIRDTELDALGSGRGMSIETNFPDVHTRVWMRGSLVAQSQQAGVYVSGAELTLETTVVRDTERDLQGVGRGIQIQGNPLAAVSLVTAVRRSVVERNHEAGVTILSTDVTIDTTVVRDTQPGVQPFGGRGIHIQLDPVMGGFARAAVRGSRIERNHSIGVSASGAELTVDGSVVRDTQPDVQGLVGRGIQIQPDPITGAAARGTVSGSLIDRNHDVGVFIVGGAEATIETSRIDETAADGRGLFGDGLSAVFYASLARPATIHVESTRISASTRAGLTNFGSFVSVGQTTIECAPIPLSGERLENDFAFEDRGGNLCGCPIADAPCKLLSSGLEPPDAE